MGAVQSAIFLSVTMLWFSAWLTSSLLIDLPITWLPPVSLLVVSFLPRPLLPFLLVHLSGFLASLSSLPLFLFPNEGPNCPGWLSFYSYRLSSQCCFFRLSRLPYFFPFPIFFLCIFTHILSILFMTPCLPWCQSSSQHFLFFLWTSTQFSFSPSLLTLPVFIISRWCPHVCRFLWACIPVQIHWNAQFPSYNLRRYPSHVSVHVNTISWFHTLV